MLEAIRSSGELFGHFERHRSFCDLRKEEFLSGVLIFHKRPGSPADGISRRLENR